MATAGVSQVSLSWVAPSGDTAQGYNVLRSTTSGGSYTNIASWTANTTPQYTDTTVTNGTTYYYVVSAINQTGTSSNSAETSGTPTATGALLSGWTDQDIGTVTVSGGATYANVSNSTFVVSGSGVGIGGTADGLNFAYKAVTGDFTVTARLFNVNWNGGGSAEKVGIMMRETLASNAVTLAVHLGDVGAREARFGTRSTTGGSMSWVGGNDYTIIPAWFRLQRFGSTFTALESSDGVNWFTIGSSTVTMANTYFVGLAVSSNNGKLNTTTFDNVQIASTGAGPIVAGTYRLLSRASGKYLDNLGSTTNGTGVGQWTSSSSNNQKWVVTNLGAGYYKLMCITGSEYLDSLGVVTAGSTVGQWAGGSGKNQDWIIQDLGTGYYKVICSANNLCLDTAGATTNGAIMQFGTSGSSTTQQWQFVAP